jgi:hypothetical protein
LGRLHPLAYGGAGGNRFLHRGGAWRGLATYYVLFFLHLEMRLVTLAGITQHPTKEWMIQMARRPVDEINGTLLPIIVLAKMVID